MASCRKEAEVETQPGTQSQWATCKAAVFVIFHVLFTLCISSLFRDFRGFYKPIINAAASELQRHLRNQYV